MKNEEKLTGAVIDYIEGHLSEKLDLERVAKAVHYSKYHLHRAFTQTAGRTIHDYVQRRQLTEAAKLLVYSDRPILEIALSAGYESQQAFTTVFREMYKKSPGRYREEKIFYPLQLAWVWRNTPGRPDGGGDWQSRIRPAKMEDIPLWMELVRQVVDGFPCLDEVDYRERLREYIGGSRAFILTDGKEAAGVMGLTPETGSIDFWGIHPRYRKLGIAPAFLKQAFSVAKAGGQLSITTFREGDRADPGCRRRLKELGFAEGELLMEFGYPTQRLVLSKRCREESGDE